MFVVVPVTDSYDILIIVFVRLWVVLDNEGCAKAIYVLTAASAVCSNQIGAGWLHICRRTRNASDTSMSRSDSVLLHYR